MTPSSKRYRWMSIPESEWEIWRYVRSKQKRRDNRVIYTRSRVIYNRAKPSCPEVAAHYTRLHRNHGYAGMNTLFIPIRKGERKPYRFVVIDLGVG